MNDSTRDEITVHAKSTFPNECCGLIVNVAGKEKYLACENVSENPGSSFVLNPLEYASAEDAGEILAIVHSHCNESAKPSDADKTSCEVSGLPWHIIAIPSETWAYICPSGWKAPLIGRQYADGILDCYTLIKDWYFEKRGIVLPEFERSKGWEDRGEDLYLKNFRSAGFVETDPNSMIEGDVILLNFGSRTVNHGGIFDGRSLMLHHARNQLSCAVVYGGFWRKHTRMVLRYKGDGL